jgi:hypothetical protein
LPVTSLQGKVKDYSGPTDSRAICRQIQKDCQERGIEMSDKMIFRIVGLFFRQIVNHMKKGDYIIVDELGEFGMTSAEKKKREVSLLKKMQERYDRGRSHNRRNCYNFQLKRKFQKFNEMRKSKDLPPWTFREYCIVRNQFTKKLHGDHYRSNRIELMK